ncbi:hypothetical protein BC831DRAFT_513829 [Entophlyctis helioformis]|nr:hypothetical protein BC831DRAFT_513829 [Entophlyctis helioformis]
MGDEAAAAPVGRRAKTAKAVKTEGRTRHRAAAKTAEPAPSAGGARRSRRIAVEEDSAGSDEDAEPAPLHKRRRQAGSAADADAAADASADTDPEAEADARNDGDDQYDEPVPAKKEGVRSSRRGGRSGRNPSKTASDAGAASASASAGVVDKYPLHGEGSIVRIKLTNFLTYSDVEFFPGPNLNMVIGPNGTGKSTVVCAIALGLAGKPDVLGRARDLHEFVKHGEDKAVIETELKTVSGHPLVITRSFERGSNHSSWKMNGTNAKERDVKAAIEALNIQVDNLCQFLPQDRVSGFAQMSPSELLRETERAAGGRQMIEWHDFLAQQRDKENDLQNSLRENQATLEQLKRRNQLLEDDVARLREGDRIHSEMRMINVRTASLEYEQKRDAYLAAKENKVKAQQEFEAVRALQEPLRERQAELKEQILQFERAASEAKQAYSRETAKIKNLVQEAGGKGDEVEAVQTEISQVKREKERHAKEIQALERAIAGLNSELETLGEKLFKFGLTPGPTSSTFIETDDGETSVFKSLATDLAECKRRAGENSEAVRQIAGRKEELAREAAALRHQHERKSRELAELDEIRSRKLANLKRFDKETYEATLWLQQNMGMFQKHVYEPVALEISLRDPRYANAVEAFVKPSHMTTFVTQCEADYKTLCREAIDVRKLRINVVSITQDVNSFRPTHSREQIQALGFDGYVKDFVDGPDPVMAFLCDRTYIHTNPIALNPIPRMKEAEDIFRTFVAGDTNYSVKSAYGQRVTRAKRLGQARYSSQSVDAELKARLEREYAEIHERQQALAATTREVEIEDAKCRAIDDQLREERSEIQRKRNEIIKYKQDYVKAKTMLETRTSRLEAMREDYESGDDRTPALQRKLLAVCQERGRIAERLCKVYEAASDIFLGRTRAILQMHAATAETERIERQLRNAHEVFGERQLALDQAKEDLQLCKLSARQALGELDNEKGKLSPEELEELNEMEETLTLDELINQAGVLAARAETIARINPAILQDYETRQVEIQTLETAIAERQENLETLRARMAETKDNWTTQLTNIVERVSLAFSSAFERIGCAGEVRIAQNDDYAKWGIEILVKFRDHEKLQLLTGTRQSGGERSVSTMLYLIALQQLSKSPFRVVDEINQGMDPRNERMVHKLIVSAACGVDAAGPATAADANTTSSQYFLITPKLLHDLEYHRNMKVLCVFNGPWIPPTLDIRATLRHKMRSLQ